MWGVLKVSGWKVEGDSFMFWEVGGFHLWTADLETGELIQERSFCGRSRLTCKSLNADIGISKSILEPCRRFRPPRQRWQEHSHVNGSHYLCAQWSDIVLLHMSFSSSSIAEPIFGNSL